MSVRLRSIMVITITNLFIIIFSVFTGTLFVRKNIERSIETDMNVVADIADHFIGSEIDSLKLKASELARILADTEEAYWSETLALQLPQYQDFIGSAVFNHEGHMTALAGDNPAPPELLQDKQVQRAFQGEKIISTTYPTETGVVFYLALPVPGFHSRVLALTIPGTYFSERLSSFTIWETGHIFIDDSDGHVIANIREEWVQKRFNFIHMAQTNKGYLGIASVVRRAIQGETGIGRFSVSGIPRICAFRPIAGSNEGWCLGVIAPLPESPARDADNGLLIVGIVALVMSVIAAVIASNFIKKPFEKIAALKEEAEANSRSKTQFLATMSHEMRTPLNAVIGLSELTLDGKIGGEERDNIEKVYTAGVTLLGIINDILDISKIESGKFELSPVNYDVPSLISDAISLNSMRIGEKPIEFKLVIDETIPSRLFGDDLRIKQIFNNLLSNAFKYTKAGTVEWRIHWEQNGDDIWIVSSVTDSGIGIRKEDFSKLFVSYSQIDTNSHRAVEGTGLGLVLTKRMVDLMDGTIGVESEYGKGSTFTVRIKQGLINGTPIGPAVAESLRQFRYITQKQSRHAQLVRIHLPDTRVLVVDDIAPNLMVVKGIMKPYGMQVDCVSSGAEAVRLIREGVKYNAIFMDHMMPEMNGIEAARIIRNEIGTEYARTVPIIALTANAIRGNEEMFLSSGFQAFLSKPIDIVQMDVVIRQWVRGKSQESAQVVAQAKPESAAVEFSHSENSNAVAEGNGADTKIEGVDLEKILELFDNDEQSLVDLFRIYIEQVPPVLDRLRQFNPAPVSGGEAAGKEALAGYVIDVHGLKGISRNIFAEKAGAMAEALEQAGKAGNLAFIAEHNGPFIKAVEQLAASIQKWLGDKLK